MPLDSPDLTDPLTLLAVPVEGDGGSHREMAWVFAEEYARLGMDERQILAIFSRPFYAGPHRAQTRLGVEAVREIVSECCAVYGRARATVKDAP